METHFLSASALALTVPGTSILALVCLEELSALLSMVIGAVRKVLVCRGLKKRDEVELDCEIGSWK